MSDWHFDLIRPCVNCPFLMRNPLLCMGLLGLTENTVSEVFPYGFYAEAVEFPPSCVGIADHSCSPSTNGNSSWRGGLDYLSGSDVPEMGPISLFGVDLEALRREYNRRGVMA